MDVRLATQVLLLQVAVVTLTLGIAGGMLAYFSHNRLASQYETQSLDVARAIAFAPAVRAEVQRYDATPLTPGPALTEQLANGQLQTLATEIQQHSHLLFVVIANNQGIRLSHPDRNELGKHVSTDPSEALAGHEVVDREEGTLGTSVRAKVPVFAPNSNEVVGEVSVGISTAAVHRQLWTDVRTAAFLVGAALMIGVVGSVVLARRWRALDAGTATARRWPNWSAARPRCCTASTRASWPPTPTGKRPSSTTRHAGCWRSTARPADRVADIGLTPRVLEVFRSTDTTPALATVGDRIVVVSARQVSGKAALWARCWWCATARMSRH